MKAIRGHYNGSVVVLDDPAPVDYAMPVMVEFPDEGEGSPRVSAATKRYHWAEAAAIDDGYSGSLADEVIRQRREGRF